MTTTVLTVAAFIFVANALHMRSAEAKTDIPIRHLPDLVDFNR